MSAKLQPPVHRLRLQAVFPETQDRAAGKVLQPLPAVSKGVGGGQAGGQVYRLRRRRGLPQRQGAAGRPGRPKIQQVVSDRKSTRLNSSHVSISYAVFCLKKKRERSRG